MKKTVTGIFCVLLAAILLCGCTVTQVPTATPTMQDPLDTLPPQTESPTASNTASADPEIPTQSATAELETETPIVTVPTVTPSVTAPEATATPKPVSDHVIEGFESGTLDQLITTIDWSAFPMFGVTNATYSLTNNNTDSKNGLLVTVADAGAVVQNITFSGTKITSAFSSHQKKYFRIFVCNNTSVNLGLSIVISNGTEYANYGVTKAKVTSFDGTSVSVNGADPSGSGEGTNSGLYLPSGFKGWVAFDATELVDYFAQANGYKLVSNTKTVTTLTVDARVHGAKANESYVIDQLCFSNNASGANAAAPSATPTPTVKPSSSWEGKYLSFNNQKTEISVSANSTDFNAEYPTFTFSGTAEMNFNAPATGNFNYYSLRYKSTQPLWMYIKYTRNGSAYEELCFLDASSKFINFNSFIDGVMDNASSKGTAITGFRFVNRGNKSATVVVSAVTDTLNSSLPKMVYLQNEYLKLGSDLVYGGAIALLEYLKEPVALVSKNGRAEIIRNYNNKSGFTVKNTSINLLNNYDTGRLVQQSYYGTFGGSDGYTPGYFSNSSWCYNPVMGGDKANNHSKIIDFKQTGSYIYVKCRPMDWGHDNSPTYSYMESTYTLEGRNVMVDNRFVDYSGYSHVQLNQELPALYVAEPLYNLVHYDGSSPWTYAQWKKHTGLADWNGVWPTFNSTENWWAWVNNDDDLFGIGLYVPNVTSVTGGIHNHGGTINYSNPSKSVPTSYIAPLRQMTIINYKPIEYSYALICGGLSEIIQSVYTMNSQNRINNQALVNYR